MAINLQRHREMQYFVLIFNYNQALYDWNGLWKIELFNEYCRRNVDKRMSRNASKSD